VEEPEENASLDHDGEHVAGVDYAEEARSSETDKRASAQRRRKSMFSALTDLPFASASQRISWHDSEARKRVIRVGWWLVGSIPPACFLVGWITQWYQRDVAGVSAKEAARAAISAAGLAAFVAVYILAFAFPLYRRSQFRLFRDRLQLEEAKTEVLDAESRLARGDSDELTLP